MYWEGGGREVVIVFFRCGGGDREMAPGKGEGTRERKVGFRAVLVDAEGM